MLYKDKIAVVTGGTRGIGAGITEALLKSGLTVVANFHSNEESAKALRSQLIQFSDFLHLKPFDVSEATEVENFYTWLEEKFGRIDILVNNAGIRKDTLLGIMSEREWDQVMDINLKSLYLMCRPAVQKMCRQRSGRIINITSPSGKLGFPGQCNYAASKAGQVGFTKSLAKEVAKRKVTVNCVSPGFIETDLLSDLPEDQKKQYEQFVPMKRFGTVKEVASAVMYLASEEASYTTGSVLEVTGGL